MLIFRIDNDDNLRTSSDGLTWISDFSEKIKNTWIDPLATIRQKFRTNSR